MDIATLLHWWILRLFYKATPLLPIKIENVPWNTKYPEIAKYNPNPTMEFVFISFGLFPFVIIEVLILEELGELKRSILSWGVVNKWLGFFSEHQDECFMLDCYLYSPFQGRNVKETSKNSAIYIISKYVSWYSNIYRSAVAGNIIYALLRITRIIYPDFCSRT